MTDVSLYPSMYSGTDKDFLDAPGTVDGNIHAVKGATSVTSGTAATTVVGLFPFRKGASFTASNTSFHCANFGDATTTVDIGVVYDDNSTYTNDVDLFVATSTAPQSGGYVTLTNAVYPDYVTTADGWVAATINTADADATADITFNVGVSYGDKIIT